MSYLGPVPPGWIKVHVTEVGDVSTGFTPSTKEAAFRGYDIPFVKPPDLTGGLVQRTRDALSLQGAKHGRTLPEGAVLVCCIGSIGKTGLTTGTVAFNQQINAVVPYAPISPKFVLYAVQHPTFQQQLRSRSSATTVAILNKGAFSQLEISLAPLSEQTRIVEAIETQLTRLDAAVAALERVQANLKRYRASVLKAAVEGRLVPTEAELARQEGRDYEPASILLQRILAERRRRWEEAQLAEMKAKGKAPKDDRWKARYKQPLAPDTEGLPHLPEGWCWATLDQVCPVFVDCAHRTPKYSDGGIPALRPRDVVDGLLNLDGAASVSEDEYQRQTARRVPMAGDIIYSRELSYGWGVDIPYGVRACMSQGMVLFRPGEGLSNAYLLAILNGPVGRQQAKRIATGSAHPHLNLNDIRSYTLPMAPTLEQDRIVERLAETLSELTVVSSQAAKSETRIARLRQSILKWAFEGKLVDQDPSDEPASVLLERLNVERQAARAAEKPKAKRNGRGTNAA